MMDDTTLILIYIIITFAANGLMLYMMSKFMMSKFNDLDSKLETLLKGKWET